jgi:2-isopropylmalate synthase
VNIAYPIWIDDVRFSETNGVLADVVFIMNGKEMTATASGTGRLDSVSNAIKELTGIQFNLVSYTEHALANGSSSDAMAYVGIICGDGKIVWGAGMHNDILTASVYALISAINRRNSD